MNKSRIALVACAVIAIARVAAAAELEAEKANNWHQWRGPSATGVAETADPPVEWSDDKNVKWKVPVAGNGSSTPIIWGNRIFLLTAIETDRVEEKAPESVGEAVGGNPFNIERPTHYYKFVVLCYDRETGNVLWEKVVTEQVPHEGHHKDHGFASQSPVTDGEHLWASFGSRGVYCLDMEGNVKWEKDLGDAVIYRIFGEAISPVLHKDSLIVNWGSETGSFIAALDKNTGEQKWKTDNEEHTSWATPLVVEHEGKTQIVVNGNVLSRGYDFETGQQIWQCGGQTRAIIPCPVVYGDLVVCMSGYPESAAKAIPLNSMGDVTGQVAWSYDQDTPYCPSPLLYGDRLWFNKSNNAILTCLDVTTGKPILAKERVSGLKAIYASPVGAAGRIYFSDRAGATLVIANEPELKVLATNQLDSGIDASPAMVGRQMFIRTRTSLYCLEAAE